MLQNKVVPPQETLLPLSEYNAEGNTVESVCPRGQCANAPQKQTVSPFLYNATLDYNVLLDYEHILF